MRFLSYKNIFLIHDMMHELNVVNLRRCGVIRMKKVCPQCLSNISQSSKYCRFCGAIQPGGPVDIFWGESGAKQSTYVNIIEL